MADLGGLGGLEAVGLPSCYLMKHKRIYILIYNTAKHQNSAFSTIFALYSLYHPWVAPTTPPTS